MRQADLVVDYVDGEPLPDEMVQYGAVFRSSAAADAYFSEAEPPTHDQWVLDGLRGTSRGVVQLANVFIREQLRAVSAAASEPSPAGDVALATLASRLSGLLTSSGDLAEASVRPQGSSATGRRGITGPRFVEPPHLVVEDGTPMILAVVQMPRWEPERTLTERRITAQPLVVVDGGIESPDGGAENPVVFGWRSVKTGVVVDGPRLTLTSTTDSIWELRVRPVRDAVVRVEVTQSRGDGDA